MANSSTQYVGKSFEYFKYLKLRKTETSNWKNKATHSPT